MLNNLTINIKKNIKIRKKEQNIITIFNTIKKDIFGITYDYLTKRMNFEIYLQKKQYKKNIYHVTKPPEDIKKILCNKCKTNKCLNCGEEKEILKTFFGSYNYICYTYSDLDNLLTKIENKYGENKKKEYLNFLIFLKKECVLDLTNNIEEPIKIKKYEIIHFNEESISIINNFNSTKILKELYLFNKKRKGDENEYGIFN